MNETTKNAKDTLPLECESAPVGEEMKYELVRFDGGRFRLLPAYRRDNKKQENTMTWSDAEINLVGGADTRFPQHETLPWAELRALPARVRELLRATNDMMTVVEQDRGLSAHGVGEKRAAIGDSAIAELEKMATRPSSVVRHLEALEEKTKAELLKGKGDSSVASEIRSHIARSESPALTATSLVSNPEVLAAVLGAPSFLSGLTEDQVNAIRERATASTESGEQTAEIKKAIEVCNGAFRAAAAKVAQRANLRRQDDNTWHL
jgi:hypothetical protein